MELDLNKVSLEELETILKIKKRQNNKNKKEEEESDYVPRETHIGIKK